MKRYDLEFSKAEKDTPCMCGMIQESDGAFIKRDEVVSVLAQSGLDIDDVIDIDVLLSALDISEDEYLAAQEDT